MALVIPALTHWIIQELPAVYRTELLVYDWHMNALPSIPPDDRLVYVALDNESLSRLPLDRPAYPLPRSFHAKIVRELHDAGAKAIAFDMWFSAPSPSDDALLADAIANAKPVFCGAEPVSQLADGQEFVTFVPPASELRPYVTPCALNTPRVFGRERWLIPNVVDSKTAERYPHMSVALAQTLGMDSDAAPVGIEGEILIRFIGPSGTFKPVSYHEVFNGTWRQSRGPNFFRGKSVLIGMLDPLVDRAITPLGEMPGTEALLQATQAMAQNLWIRRLNQIASYGITCVLTLLLVIAVLKFNIRHAVAVFVAEGIVWIFVAHRAFATVHLWIESIEPALCLLFTLMAVSAYEMARVRRVFHRFMPSGVAERMLESNPGEAASTKEVEASVVFCDVRNSTTLAEIVSPATIDELLGRYFTAGEEAALRLGTELDKFVGDEIMLYFEDRPGFESHAVRAVRWAFGIQDACKAITDSGLAGEIGFRVGVGVATGVVRIGTVGARQRIQHTVIGDTVNTASRVQALTKEFNEPIIVAESTCVKASDKIKCAFIGEVPIRGKQKPMKLYKPLQIL
jgi:adenylate cyclase